MKQIEINGWVISDNETEVMFFYNFTYRFEMAFTTGLSRDDAIALALRVHPSVLFPKG